MTRSDKPWIEVYRRADFDVGQYKRLLSKDQLAVKKFDFDPELIDKVPGKFRLLFEGARLKLQRDGGEPSVRDDRSHIAIDRLTQSRARLRPASYLFHVLSGRLLDVVVGAGLSEKGQFSTLRQRLFDEDPQLEPNSSLYSCKLGISGIICSSDARGDDVVLMTRRAKTLNYYPGRKHASFSGGADLKDILSNSDSVSGVISRGARRECLEELGVDLPVASFVPMGLWYDLERLAVQAFVKVEIERADSIAPRLNAEEVSWWGWESPRSRPVANDETPELAMFREVLR